MTDQRSVRDTVLDLLAAGRREVENRVRVAHWVGEMAVTYGLKEMRRRLDESAASPPSEDHAVVAPSQPFDGFDDLPASELVQLLPRFPMAELETIRAYEVQQRARRTVLAKLDQLLGP